MSEVRCRSSPREHTLNAHRTGLTALGQANKSQSPAGKWPVHIASAVAHTAVQSQLM